MEQMFKRGNRWIPLSFLKKKKVKKEKVAKVSENKK